ncbi:MAG TPA: NUDIX domain-containing protein [Thermoleophilaceae bacterium]
MTDGPLSKSSKTSAGLLLYRLRDDRLEVFIAHMGGPFWASKDEGGWSMVKGEYQDDEDPFTAACREFLEETGSHPPPGRTLELGEIKQPSGKRIVAWAIESDFNEASVRSNTFRLEWPRGSGQQREFPEIDRAGWFDTATARQKLVKGQMPFIEVLERQVLGVEQNQEHAEAWQADREGDPNAE